MRGLDPHLHALAWVWCVCELKKKLEGNLYFRIYIINTLTLLPMLKRDWFVWGYGAQGLKIHTFEDLACFGWSWLWYVCNMTAHDWEDDVLATTFLNKFYVWII